jgi:small conductance mechanosensitive channel
MAFTSYVPLVEALTTVAVVAAIGYFGARALSHRLRERGASPSIVQGVRVTISLLTIAVAVGVVAYFNGPFNLLSGVTLSGFAGLAVTLALQTTLQNIIAGYMLFRSRMLRLNDSIEIGGVKGRVTIVGVVTSTIHLEDGSVASVSNSTLLNGPLINRTAAERLKGEY